MRKKRAAIVAVAVFFMLVGVLFLARYQRSPLKWAKNLQLRDVEKIELVVSPSSSERAYRRMDVPALPQLIRLINSCHGRRIQNPEPLTGSTITLYVTMMDGTLHTVKNIANTYLSIDGVCFYPGFDWLCSWEHTYGLTKTDSPIPDGFIF